MALHFLNGPSSVKAHNNPLHVICNLERKIKALLGSDLVLLFWTEQSRQINWYFFLLTTVKMSHFNISNLSVHANITHIHHIHVSSLHPFYAVFVEFLPMGHLRRNANDSFLYSASLPDDPNRTPPAPKSCSLTPAERPSHLQQPRVPV